LEKVIPDIPVVVRRMVSAEQFKEPEAEPIILTAVKVAMISHRQDTYLVIPLDDSLPNLDGDSVKEEGYTESHSKAMVISYFGKDKELSEEVWYKVIKKVNLGMKVMLAVDSSGTKIIEDR